MTPKIDSLFCWLGRHVRVVLPIVLVVAVAPSYLHAYQLTPNGVSEVPTLFPRDTIIVNHAAYKLKFPYSNLTICRTGAIKRGEMVLVKLPDGRGVAPKRVMGLPGETIELKDNRMIVNGAAVRAERLNPSQFAWVPETAKMGSVIENEDGHWISYTPEKGENRTCSPIRLTADHYFVIGDNRDESVDSRVWGPIIGDSILGNVVVTLPTGLRKVPHGL
jgi:signal peptidase I